MREGFIVQTGRVPWNEMIRRTFGSAGNALLEARWSFGAMIGSAARVFAAVAHNEKSIRTLSQPDLSQTSQIGSRQFLEDWIGYNPDSFGRGYVNFAIERLHELTDLRDTIEPYLSCSVHRAVAEYEAASLKLQQLCSCYDCEDGEDPMRNQKRCVYRLGEFIIVLLWQLSLMNVDTMIQPTYQGLDLLYGIWSEDEIGNSKARRMGGIAVLLSYLKASTVYQAAKYLFVGDVVDDEELLTRSHLGDGCMAFVPLAQVASGVSIFMDTLIEISDRPETRRFLHILPGTIEAPSGTHFSLMQDGTSMNIYPDDESKPIQDFASLRKKNTTPMKSRLLVQETLSELTATIEFSGPKGNILKGPMALQVAIFRSVGLVECTGRGCKPITIPSSPEFIFGDGITATREVTSPQGKVKLRTLSENMLARCISVASPYEYHFRSVIEPGCTEARLLALHLLRRRECIPCCIRAGLSLSSQAISTYITL